MAGPKKKKAVAPEEGSSGEQSETELMDQDVIMADFEGRNPDGGDFHGIQQLLRQLFLKAHVNLSQLTDIIIAQQGLGSVLKQSLDDDDGDGEEDDTDNDVFGITTVVNLTANKEKECVQQLFENLRSLVNKHGEGTTEQQIDSILSDDSKNIALLLNERFLNIPAKIADPLMDSLLNEVTRMAKKNPSFRFDYYIMICKTYKENKDATAVFINEEEEVFWKNSEVSFEFSVADESDTGVGGSWGANEKQMVPQRRVLVLTGERLPQVVQSVRAFVN